MLMLTSSSFSNTFTIAYKSLLLLYVTKKGCPACELFNTVFMRLVNNQALHGVQMAIVHYDDSIGEKAQQFIRQTKQTPEIFIDKTPLLILFNNGMPLAKYTKENYSEAAVVNFVTTVMRDVNVAPTAAAPPSNIQPQQGFYFPPQQQSTIQQPVGLQQQFPATGLRGGGARQLPNSIYDDEIPTHFDQPQYGYRPPVSAPITWRMRK